MRRRSLLMLGVLGGAGVAGLTACSAGATSSSPGSGAGSAGKATSVVLGLTTEPENLDYSSTDGAAIPQILLNNVYQGLVKLDDAGQIVPSLASKWTQSEDLRAYTFDLVTGAIFSNGTPFTADAVKFSIERVMNGGWTTGLSSKMEVVESVTVNSPQQVTVTLKQPSNNWLFDMATRVGTMYTSDGVSDLANTPVGTGPFTVESWSKGSSIVLARRADAWGEAPALEKVTFQFFKDINAENSALLSGSVNVIVALGSFDTLAQFSDTSKFQVVRGTTNSEVTLSMNNAAGLFSDVRVRQAVMHAIDRQKLVDNVVAGYGTLIGSNVPPTDPWYEDLTGEYPYDPAKATQLLTEAGVQNATFRFRIPSTPATMVAAAQVVKSDLAAVGLTAEIEVLDFPAQWLEQVFIAHDYDMSIVNHLEPRDISNYGNPDYYFGYNNPEVIDLLASADAGTTDQQVQDLKQAARIITADAAADWLYLEDSVGVADVSLQGLPQNNLGEAYDVTSISWS